MVVQGHHTVERVVSSSMFSSTPMPSQAHIYPLLACDIFGCNCDGGCRHGNNLAEATLTGGHGRIVEITQVALQDEYYLERTSETSLVEDFISQYKDVHCKTNREKDVSTCLGKIILDVVQAKGW
jgi:hypothetical protein